MDYRSYENKVNEIKTDVINYVLSGLEKNNNYIESIVDSYYEQLNNGDVSIKSFKLKILHSQNNSEKFCNELQELLLTKEEDMKKFLDGFFIDYEKNIKSYVFSPTRKADILQLNYLLKRKKQDFLVRINNLEKDYQNKAKDNEVVVQEKIKAFNQFVSENNRRLSIDLVRLNDNCKKEYLTLERSLLDVDDIEKIQTIKNNIKTIRENSLDNQNSVKYKYYDTIKEENIDFTKKLSEINLNHELYKKDYEKKNLDYKHEITLINLLENKNIFEYDYQKDIESIAKYEDNLNKYLDTIIKINEKVLSNEEKTTKEYTELLLSRRVHECTLKYYGVNFYDPAIRMVTRLYEFFNDIKEMYEKMIVDLKNRQTENFKKISEKLDSADDAAYKYRKTTREAQKESVIVGFDKMYALDYLLKQYQLITGTIDKAIVIIDNAVSKINSINDKNSDLISNIVLRRKNLNNENIQEEIDLVNSCIESLENSFFEYKDTYLKNRNEEKKENELKYNRAIQKEERAYQKNSYTIEKQIKLINKEYVVKLEKDLKKINLDNQNDKFEASKLLKYRKETL